MAQISKFPIKSYATSKFGLEIATESPHRNDNSFDVVVNDKGHSKVISGIVPGNRAHGGDYRLGTFSTLTVPSGS